MIRLLLLLVCGSAFADDSVLMKEVRHQLALYAEQAEICDQRSAEQLPLELITPLGLSATDAVGLLLAYEPISRSECMADAELRLVLLARQYLQNPDKQSQEVAKHLFELLSISEQNQKEIHELYERQIPRWIRDAVRREGMLSQPYDAEKTIMSLFPGYQPQVP